MKSLFFRTLLPALAVFVAMSAFNSLKAFDAEITSQSAYKVEAFLRSVVQESCPSEDVLVRSARGVGMKLEKVSTGFPVPIRFTGEVSYAYRFSGLSRDNKPKKGAVYFYFSNDGCLLSG